MVRYSRKGCRTEYRCIRGYRGRRMKLLIVRPEGERQTSGAPGVLWLHGGGYLLGFPEMVFLSRAADLVRQGGAVIVSPAYSLSLRNPYPAALSDCFHGLMYMKNHARELGIRDDQLMVGGESAGGGLAAALCLYVRDRKCAQIAFQMPLYPMLDCQDTPSSRNNYERIWNTRRNHLAWRLYLRSLRKRKAGIPKYASPACCRYYGELPPAYSFVFEREPFFWETRNYVENLRRAGVEARLDIYPGGYHAFDMMEPDSEISRKAAKNFVAAFRYAREHYFAEQNQ